MRNRLISLGITLLATLALAPGAWAATFTVNSTAGGLGSCPAACTLEGAITAANGAAPADPAPTIQFGVTSIGLSSSVPAISRAGTFVDGCNSGRTQLGTPNTPAGAPCVALVGSGAPVGLRVTSATGVVVQGVAMTGFPRAVHLRGADTARVRGNRFGIGLDGTTDGPNGVAVSITGYSVGGLLQDPATDNIIGGPSDAAQDPAACDTACNLIVNSTAAGIDLVGDPGSGDAPGGADGSGTSIVGNWIGVSTAAGTAKPNAVAIRIGDAQDTTIGGPGVGHGNVIAGNTTGIDQGTGTTSVTLLNGVFGLSPSQDIGVAKSVPNGQWNARLRGGGFGLGPFVQGVTFGPTAVGLQIDGSYANLIGSVFRSPDSARFTAAAVKVGPGGDHVFIGSNAGISPFGCFPLIDSCNVIGDTGPGAPGIWINGADDARIWRNLIGAIPAAPLNGPPIRIDAGAVGALIGEDDPELRNALTRLDGPAIEISGSAQNIVVADNEGISVNAFGTPNGLFTDLRPDPGPGNAGSGNGGIQPPVILLATSTGIGGTALPGAAIRVLQQQRAAVLGDPPEPVSEGYTQPTTPSTTTADETTGFWSLTFPTALKEGQKLLASQTTANGSSEYAVPEAATIENPAPIVTFTNAPAAVVNVRTATFTFTVPPAKAGSKFECSLDGGSYVGCTSPYTLNGLDIGGHQLRVRATDLVGKQGPPASRTWIVQFDEPLTPQPAAASASSAGVVRFSSIVSLPSARRCISKRSLRITVRAPKGGRVKSAEVRIGGRKVGSSRGAKTIPVSLKGLPRGRFVVRVKVTLADGRVISGSRTYRTCAKKRTRR